MEVTVGQDQDKQTFLLHKDVVTKFSDFLAAAVREAWRKDHDTDIKLPEATPAIFRIFQVFVYGGSIHSQEDGDSTAMKDDARYDPEYDRLAAAWLLGEYLQASAFQDAVADTLIDKVKYEQLTPLWMYKDIYAGSPRESGMKRLLVDLAVTYWSKASTVEAGKVDRNSEFFLELSAEHADRRDKGDYSTPLKAKDVGCAYHEHGDKEPCYKTMFG